MRTKRSRECILLVLVLLLAAASPAVAGTFSVFSRTYVRDTGEPDNSSDTFTVAAPGPYTLRIDNGGGELNPVSSAVVTLNGTVVVRTSDFNQNVQLIERPVTLAADNQISVDLRSIPESGFVLWILGVDEGAPTITATVTPAPNAAGWHNSDPTVTFTCADAVSGIGVCPDPVVVRQEGASQVVTGVASDLAGNQASIQVTIHLDRTPPTITLATPAAGPVETNAATIEIAGSVADANPVVAFEVAGASVPFPGGAFVTAVLLAEGNNHIVARGRDVAGNLGTAEVDIVRFTLPEIAIASPVAQTLTSQATTLVTGTVSAGATAVEVNGVAGSVSGTSFSVTGVPLFEGNNLLTAVVTDSRGRNATATVQVIRDSTAPRVAIHAPAAGFITTSPTVTVSGMVNDLIVGSFDPSEAEVIVNGVQATVANRTFVAAGVPLAVGDNTLEAVATDLTGNVGRASLSVRRESLNGQARIEAVSGDLQVGPIGTTLPAALMVAVTDGAGNPLASRQVMFRVVENNGMLTNEVGSGPAVLVTTGPQGRARATWTLGNRAGAGKNRVEATSPGIAGVAVFTATGLPAAGAKISVDSGNLQFGVAGQELARPLVAVVTDEGHNRIPGMPVTFRVIAGGGRFAGQETTTVETDAYGRALAPLTLGPDAGQDNNLVEADFPGNPGGPVVFAASGRTAGDPAATAVIGVVLDNSNQPVPGVTIKIEETELATRTDAQGQFRLTGAPVGRIRLVADGSTATRPGSWPSLEYELVTVAGQDNTVGMPIFLLPIDLAHGVFVDETRGGTLTLEHLPGFSLQIAPGSATFPGGGKSGVVSVTLVHSDKVPMIPNFGQQPRFIVTIQPAGVRFDPPAALTMPNVDGLAPGEITEMYSFDHDLGMFVSIGTATVSADGTVLRSDPGVGVVEGGWHCGGNPSASGGAQNANVDITTGEPVKLKKDDTSTISASGGPQPGTYSWSTDSDKVSFQGPTSGPNVSSVSIKGMKPGTSKVKVTYTCESGASDTDEIEVLVATKDVVVIGWVDPSPINLAALEGGANLLLRTSLNSFLCGPLLGAWTFLGKPSNLYTDGDRRYANGFLLKNSPNQQPPSTINPDSVRAARDYRLFNRLQAYIKNNGGSPQVVEYLHNDPDVGPTPDPCGLLSPSEGQAHGAHGARGISSGNAVYQIAQGRLGSLGQLTDLTINNCFQGYLLANTVFPYKCINHPIAIGSTTPWIYSVIRFGADSNHLPVIRQIFPTYYVYEDNQLVATFPQSDAETFIALDDSSLISPGDIP